jgi:RND family efflux transporter MFP subunit
MRLLPALLLLSTAALAQAPKPAAPPPSAAAAAAPAPAHECLIEPQQRIEIRSPVNALIDKVLVERGSVVRAGDVLVQLDASVEREALAGARQRAQSDSELQVARARAEYAREKFRRRDDLRRQGFITAQERDEAEAEQRVAEAELALATDNRRLAGTEAQRLEAMTRQRTLRAPFSGVVTERLQHPGELAFTGEGSRPILRMAQTHPLRVEAVMPTSMVGKIRVGSRAEITPEAPLAGSWQATVRVVDQVFDAASGSFGVRLELPNANGAIPAGVRCKVRFL